MTGLFFIVMIALLGATAVMLVYYMGRGTVRGTKPWQLRATVPGSIDYKYEVRERSSGKLIGIVYRPDPTRFLQHWSIRTWAGEQPGDFNSADQAAAALWQAWEATPEDLRALTPGEEPPKPPTSNVRRRYEELRRAKEEELRRAKEGDRDAP